VRIAVLPGDGIGVEIVAEAVRVLEHLRAAGLDVAIESAPIGGAGCDAAGKPLPDATLELATGTAVLRAHADDGASQRREQAERGEDDPNAPRPVEGNLQERVGVFDHLLDTHALGRHGLHSRGRSGREDRAAHVATQGPSRR
jgi:hypothetical protein